jgi:hypothetical protein
LRFVIAQFVTVSWIISGLVRDGTAWITQPPLYVAFLLPFLIAAFLTFVVTFIQHRYEGRPASQPYVEVAGAYPRHAVLSERRVPLTTRQGIAIAAVVALFIAACRWGNEMIPMRAYYPALAEENAAVARGFDSDLALSGDDPSDRMHQLWIRQRLHFERLEAKYRHAATRSWITVVADPPPPD